MKWEAAGETCTPCSPISYGQRLVWGLLPPQAAASTRFCCSYRECMRSFEALPFHLCFLCYFHPYYTVTKFWASCSISQGKISFWNNHSTLERLFYTFSKPQHKRTKQQVRSEKHSLYRSWGRIHAEPAYSRTSSLHAAIPPCHSKHTRCFFSSYSINLGHAPVYVSSLCMKSVRQSVRVIFLNIKWEWIHSLTPISIEYFVIVLQPITASLPTLHWCKLDLFRAN